MDKRDEITEFFGNPISIYTSEQACEDEILIKTGHPLINYMTTNLHSKLIEPFVTENMDEATLTKNLIDSTIIEIKKINKPDWFYCIHIKGYKLFVAQNETSGWTIMSQEDY